MTIQEGSSPKAFLILAILFATAVGVIYYAVRSASWSNFSGLQTIEKSELNDIAKPSQKTEGLLKSLSDSVQEFSKFKEKAENIAKNLQAPASPAATAIPRIASDATGEDIYNSMGCGTCHAMNGRGVAPSLVGIYGQQRTCRGKKIIVDERYLQLVMIDPNACSENPQKKSIMPSYAGLINPDRRFAIAKYIKTLK